MSVRISSDLVFDELDVDGACYLTLRRELDVPAELGSGVTLESQTPCWIDVPIVLTAGQAALLKATL